MRMMMRTTIGLSLVLLVVSGAALARQTQSTHQQPVPSIKAKPCKTSNTTDKVQGKRPRAGGKASARGGRRSRGDIRQHQAAALPPPDQHLGPMRVVGAREVGSAAWYGGRHLGMRTASGERLDAVHATAAHRSLPLHSLVRVTNLRNGRSVIARITDRGPVSRSLLIDLSPRCAQELDMVRSGIAPVSVERVAPAASPAVATAVTAAAPQVAAQVREQAASLPAR